MAERTARQIMTAEPVVIAPDIPVKEAARIMAERRVGALPVVEGGSLVGIVTEGDLIMQDVRVEFPTSFHLLDGLILFPSTIARFEAELRKAVAATVADIMTADPVTVPADATVEDVATLMVDRDVSRLPVMDGDQVIGIVSKSDIVRALASEE